jgi:hypothetical protein
MQIYRYIYIGIYLYIYTHIQIYTYVYTLTNLGTRCEKGWVPETGVFDFTPESLKGKFFIDKKFKNDADYKSSILEGIRYNVNI